MATKLDAEAYKYFKSLPESEWTDEERRAVNDYERAEAQAPSNDELEFANFVINKSSRNPSTDGAYYKKTGEYQKALDIIQRDRAYVATKGTRGMDAYVKKVNRIPDDLIKDNQFTFNWKSVYENQPGNEKLRDTEADYDKLKKFIDSKMYDVTDPVSFQKIAYDLHMYNPNTMTWSEFIDSEQGKEFQKYVKDVEKYQREKSINDIFDNESNLAVDFMLPVAKENARQALLKGEEPSKAAIGFDAATNLAMMMPGKAGLITAPIITNAGQVIMNDEEPAVAGINTVLGGATNVAAPFAIRRGARYLETPVGKGFVQKAAVQGTADKIAERVANIRSKFLDGGLHGVRNSKGELVEYVNGKSRIVYTKNMSPANIERYKNAGYTVKPFKDAGTHSKGIISDDDWKFLLANENILRTNPLESVESVKPNKIVPGLKKGVEQMRLGQDLRNQAFNAVHNPKSPSMKRLADASINRVLDKLSKGEKISSLDRGELIALGYNPKESVTSFILRQFPDIARNYLINYGGRSASSAAVMRVPQMFLGTDLSKYLKENENKKKMSISDIFGE